MGIASIVIGVLYCRVAMEPVLHWAGRLLECPIALCITHLRATVPLLCADHRVYCTIYIRVHQAFHFCAYFQRSSEKHANAKLERTLALLPLLHAISPRPPSPFFESKYPHSVNLRIVMMIDSLKGLVPRRTMWGFCHLRPGLLGW